VELAFLVLTTAAPTAAVHPSDGELMTNKTERIRVLNDTLRTKRIGGRIMLTSGVAALPDQARQQAVCAVRDFDAFTPNDDPVLFKIDYYDRDLTYGSPDPADPQQTTRVLTIMLASEY
jgi:hypothetical protein